MEKSNKRGKIPQSDWPLIMTRYEAGETLASIARTYDCSPPAISYVVSKSRARKPGRDRPEASASERESQLVKGIAGDSTEAGLGRSSRPEEEVEHGGTVRGAQVRATGANTDSGFILQPFGNGRDARTSREVGGFVRDGFAERGPQPPQAQAARFPETAKSRRWRPHQENPGNGPRHRRRCREARRTHVTDCTFQSVTVPRPITVLPSL